VTVQLVTFAAILIVLVPLSLALRGTNAPATLLLLPVMVALLFGFALGCALIVAVLHAYYRDVAPILTAALLPWFFLTPIFYQPDRSIAYVEQHPAVATLLNWFNPMAPFIRGLRDVLYYGTAPDLARRTIPPWSISESAAASSDWAKNVHAIRPIIKKIGKSGKCWSLNTCPNISVYAPISTSGLIRYQRTPSEEPLYFRRSSRRTSCENRYR
jgi:ABC-2 type transporter